MRIIRTGGIGMIFAACLLGSARDPIAFRVISLGIALFAAGVVWPMIETAIFWLLDGVGMLGENAAVRLNLGRRGIGSAGYPFVKGYSANRDHIGEQLVSM